MISLLFATMLVCLTFVFRRLPHTFASRYIPDIETRFNRGRRILEVGGSVFNHGVELIGKRTEKTLEQSEFEQLSWYVLNNATEADEYVK